MKVKRLINNLMVENVRNSSEFYISNLGFELVIAVPDGTQDVEYSYRDGVTYAFAIIKKGEVELMFQSLKSVRDEFPEVHECGVGCSAIFYMQVTDIEELFEKLEYKTNIIKGLHESFYGMKEFYIKDPDGYILGFAEKA